MSFSRSNGRLMKGGTNFNIRSERDRDGQVVVEKQTRSLWGTTYGEWKRDVNKGNHLKAREYAKREKD